MDEKIEFSAIDLSHRPTDNTTASEEGAYDSEFKASWATSFYAGAGDFGLTFSSTRSGDYLVSVSIRQNPVGNSPLRIRF